MCSIVGVFDTREDASLLREQALEMSRKLRHRGPDWSGIFSNEKAILVHERLSIVGVENGAQPLYSSDKNQVLAVNGEIYNHREIRNSLKNYNFATNSDCEVILPLYREKGTDFLNDLNGIFAFALYDQTDNSYLIARDPMGVIPLYYGRNEDGVLFVASEMKALTSYCKHIEDFPPGHFWSSKNGKIESYYHKDWMDYENVKDNVTSVPDIKAALEAAVHRQLMCDVPYGVLLSGGLDSSITSAIAKRYSAKRIESDDQNAAWWPQLHSFAVGLSDSPDLVAAKKVAEQIGTIHHEINFTVQEGFDALKDVIYHLETYDVTTVRASTPMYLMARVIKSMGIKMVLSGEGADEIFGGYLYFHKAPNPEELHKETVRKISKLYKYDCLRSNKSMASWGIESRVPFLDLEFLDVAMRQNPKDKMPSKERMEKYILRQAFEDYIPKEVAWRQKEQFSDGVGYSWIDGLKEKAANEISDEQMESAKYKFPINTPRTKEEYLYRSIFAELFPEDDAVKCVPFEESIACSTAIVFEWDQTLKEMADPSGRSVKTVHDKSY